MKKLLHLLLVVLIASCTNDDGNSASTSENDVDAARNFLRAALDGEYVKARNYVVQDSTNLQLLSTFEDNYRQHMNREDKRAYREATLRFPEVRKVNDTLSVVTYSNSYKNKVDSLRVIRRNGNWLVDFKYSFMIKDSLP